MKYEKEPDRYIARKQLGKLHRKFQVQLQDLVKKQKFEENMEFREVFACFVIAEIQDFIRKLSNSAIS